VSSGFTVVLKESSEDDRRRWSAKSPATEWAGIANTEDMAEWLFNHHFAAHCGDNLAFEVLRQYILCFQCLMWTRPLRRWPGYLAASEGRMLHETLIGGWGCPIGNRSYFYFYTVFLKNGTGKGADGDAL
jgi:hypothetical protein